MDKADDERLADAIWGSADPRGSLKRVAALSNYLDNARAELNFSCDGASYGEESLSALLLAIHAIKSGGQKRKSSLRLESVLSGDEENQNPASVLPLELAIRVAFFTSCLLPGQVVGGEIYRPRWKDTETLEGFIARVYPKGPAASQDVRNVQIGKLSVGYLAGYAGIELKWTHKLSDHLILLRGDGWKSLYIFQHLAVIRVSLDAMSASDADMLQSPGQALQQWVALFFEVKLSS
jgi:hypothetical protein